MSGMGMEFEPLGSPSVMDSQVHARQNIVTV